MPHPDLVWIVTQSTDDMVVRGQETGMREATAFLHALAAEHTHRKQFAEGITDAADNITPDQVDEFYERDEQINADALHFDPAPLVAALEHVVDQCRPLGHKTAIEHARDLRDSAEIADPLDEDDYDDPDDLVADQESRDEQIEYAAGAEHACRALVAHFGVDPDPTWEPTT